MRVIVGVGWRMEGNRGGKKTGGEKENESMQRNPKSVGYAERFPVR